MAAQVKEEEVIKEEGDGSALCAEVDVPAHGVFDLSIAGGFGVPEFKEKRGPRLPVGVALCVSGDGLVEGLGAIEVEVVEVALEEALEVGGGAAFLGAIFGASPKEEGGLLEVTPLLEDAAASTAGLSDERDDLDIAVLGVDPCLFERAEDVEASEEGEFGVAFFVGGLGGGLGFPCELVGRFFEVREGDLVEGFVFFEQELCGPIEPDLADGCVLEEALCGVAGLVFGGVIGEQGEDTTSASAGILGEGRVSVHDILDGTSGLEGAKEAWETLTGVGV